MSDHHPFFAPSKLPALSQCLHYENKEAESPEADEGDSVHAAAADLLTRQEQLFATDPGIHRKAVWLAMMVKRILANIVGVENRLEITGNKGEPITYGHVDAWGYDREGCLTLIDHKRSVHRDMTPQFAAYALGLMQARRAPHCRAIVLCYSEQSQIDYYFTLEEAQGIVWDLYTKAINKQLYPPRENEFCSWCAKRPTCPVWTQPANKTMEIVGKEALSPLTNYASSDPLVPIMERLELLKEDPEQLGLFYDGWCKAEALVKDAGLKERIKELLEKDIDSVPGWTLQERKGRKVTDTSMLKQCWEDNMDSPLPLTELRPTVALVRKHEKEKAKEIQTQGRLSD
jgi:hypothetical protein